jgi:GNAT superfamily N-acetyltransferase
MESEILKYDNLNADQKKNFERIYLDAFPSNERRDFNLLIKGIKSRNYFMFALVIESNVSAIACIYSPLYNSFALLDYFAVDSNLRGKGIGSIFFRKLAENNSIQTWNLLLEVEDPLFDNDDQIKTKRIQFYENNGAKLILNYDYILPDLDGSGKTTQMKIMIVPKIQIEDRLKFIEFIKLVFKELYLSDDSNETLNLNIKKVPKTLNF